MHLIKFPKYIAYFMRVYWQRLAKHTNVFKYKHGRRLRNNEKISKRQ